VRFIAFTVNIHLIIR